MSNFPDISRCPHCGLDTGFYLNVRVTGWIQCNYNFDGATSDNTEMWDDERLQYATSKVMRCQECHHKVGKVSVNHD